MTLVRVRQGERPLRRERLNPHRHPPAPAVQLNQGLSEVALTGGASCWLALRDLE
jgi:hypothetical protein